ncbi:MAG: gas vesicle protein [Thermoleophilia bacterium]|nr:gas vesicle protein [Thermoleophilia bacterium]
MTEMVAREKNVALLDLLDRIVTKGVVVYGDVTLSVADVDLIYLGLKVLLTSVETADQWKRATAEGRIGSSEAGLPVVLSHLL